ncbi:polysaccharide deacetylase family protein [Agriterribacter sp.]|uniref:polysaccharide deacetylase family protein n=1 Tax=Agriterribacter sp. TaxID=2821509 RepID=UPI002C733724|nr:polysaccharide deacetylase family protein [Agriterribacter sp.]HRP57554.1 polysaccharide deacetylase family protein [Agriterribacter sp.]
MAIIVNGNMKNVFIFFAVILLAYACRQKAPLIPELVTPNTAMIQSIVAENAVADAATIMERPEVPVLCYHQIREWRGNESRGVKDVVVPPAVFKSQLQLLADSGYQTVLPDDLYAYLTTGKPLPAKPIMLTYDDSDLDQYKIAAPEMKKHGFKGVFFIMTVSLGRSIYMNRAQVKELSDEGHVIASHTWDHKNVKKYKEDDWETQIVKPARQLEEITGRPVQYFAYPFGAWNKEAIPELKKYNIKAAFQLSTKRDSTEPLYTIRRMIVPGDWSAATMYRAMKRTFKG